jgi:hypothetical protein
MRDRAMGILFIASGVCFVAAVVNPPLLSTWGGSVPDVVATASAHRTAWLPSTWLIAVSVGGGLALASTTYDLSVTSTVLGTRALPGWYLGGEDWANGLGTAYFALLAPAAMVRFGLSIRRTRVFPAWTGTVLLIAAVTLLGQFAAFRGALPFPQFLAFIALGIAALVRSHSPAPAAPTPAPAELVGKD